jgi:hypothetical protein
MNATIYHGRANSCQLKKCQQHQPKRLILLNNSYSSIPRHVTWSRRAMYITPRRALNPSLCSKCSTYIPCLPRSACLGRIHIIQSLCSDWLKSVRPNLPFLHVSVFCMYYPCLDRLLILKIYYWADFTAFEQYISFAPCATVLYSISLLYICFVPGSCKAWIPFPCSLRLSAQE